MTTAAFIVWIVIAIVVVAVLIAGYYLWTTRKIARHALKLVPPPGKFVTLDGNRIHYVDTGEGRPILFVHGLGGSLFNFYHPLFSGLVDDYRLIALDRPGSGYSTRAGSVPASPVAQGDFIARFIDALGLERPLVVGHSLGGAIVLALAIRHPKAISGIALMAPLTRHRDAVPPEFAALAIASPMLRRIVAETIAAPMAIRNRDKTLAFVFGPNEPPDDYAIAGGALASLRPSHFYATSTDIVAIGDDMKELEKRYGEIDMPAGLLAGAQDRVLDSGEHGVAMTDKIANLDLEIIDGVGHMPQYAATERVAAFIRRMAERAFAD